MHLLMATGDGGRAPGIAGVGAGGGPPPPRCCCSPPALQGALFLGVVELDTGLVDDGTFTGLVGVGGGGGATGTAGLMKG